MYNKNTEISESKEEIEKEKKEIKKKRKPGIYMDLNEYENESNKVSKYIYNKNTVITESKNASEIEIEEMGITFCKKRRRPIQLNKIIDK